MKPILLFIHLAGVILWVGGMFFAHFCLRPVAAAQLQPPQRLPLLAAVLGRFFAVVTASIAAIVVSGLAMMLAAGFGAAPRHWHLMFGTGLVMAGIFAMIYWRLFSRLKAAVAARDWPAGGAAMNSIRKWVVTNLALGFLTVAIATLGPLASG